MCKCIERAELHHFFEEIEQFCSLQVTEQFCLLGCAIIWLIFSPYVWDVHSQERLCCGGACLPIKSSMFLFVVASFMESIVETICTWREHRCKVVNLTSLHKFLKLGWVCVTESRRSLKQTNVIFLHQGKATTWPSSDSSVSSLPFR